MHLFSENIQATCTTWDWEGLLLSLRQGNIYTIKYRGVLKIAVFIRGIRVE